MEKNSRKENYLEVNILLIIYVSIEYVNCFVNQVLREWILSIKNRNNIVDGVIIIINR